MPCPTLLLYTTLDISIDELQTYLCVRFSPKEKPIGSPHSTRIETQIASIGPICITLDPKPVLDTPAELGVRDWTLAVEFDCTYHWSEMRILLALKMSHHFHLKGGYSFAWYDTGSPVFECDENHGLMLSDKDQEYFSRYPSPFPSHTFCRLPLII
jgi:hypothetical protein